MSISRGRLTPEESRSAALEAARILLIEAGPQAVTLKAVAARIGRTHANLLLHFGSAAIFRPPLPANLAERVTAHIGKRWSGRGQGEADPREIVDRTFRRLRPRRRRRASAAWMILSGKPRRARSRCWRQSTPRRRLGQGHEEPPVHETPVAWCLPALGDSLLGAPMAGALACRRKRRELARAHLLSTLGVAGEGRAP
jgi:AcrR family transcriptional regulator